MRKEHFVRAVGVLRYGRVALSVLSRHISSAEQKSPERDRWNKPRTPIVLCIHKYSVQTNMLVDARTDRR